jgi:hypothetical protein
MHTDPQWTNKHHLPPPIDDKRREPKMTPCLQALVNQVNELRKSGLQACHYAEEFTLRWIHPLSHQDNLAYECPQFADPTHEPAASKILNSFIVDVELIF